MPIEKSAGAVIFCKENDGTIKYLLLEHRAGHWNFPKGLIEKKEKIEDAALRECREETGLKKIKLITGFKETIRYFFKVKYDYQVKERGWKLGENVLKFVTYFLAESEDNKVKLSFEHIRYAWLTFEEAMKKLKRFKNSREILKKANEFLTKRIR